MNAGAFPLRQTATDADAAGSGAAAFELCGIAVLADWSGALILPDARALIVSDLHLEKGSSLAMRGVLLPPYDSAATLLRFAAVIARYRPQLVIALGDSFHDGDGPGRLASSDAASLRALQQGRDWIWISGNHDETLPASVGGDVCASHAIASLRLRHEPSGAAGEVAGHLHPVARVTVRGRSIRRRCFATDGERLVMPAFGAYAGGLNVRDAAFSSLFALRSLVVHLMGADRIHTLHGRMCGGD